MAVAACVDEADFGVDAFDEGVADAEFDGVDDAVKVQFEAACQLNEGADAAVGGAADPASEIPWCSCGVCNSKELS